MSNDAENTVNVKWESVEAWLYIKNGNVVIPEAKCIECGSEATIFDVSPFLEEIYPNEENPEVWWCELCYQEPCDAI